VVTTSNPAILIRFRVSLKESQFCLSIRWARPNDRARPTGSCQAMLSWLMIILVSEW